jgi:Tol biopolymer transport system component
VAVMAWWRVVLASALAAAPAGCFNAGDGILSNTVPPYMGPPPSTVATKLGESIRWELLEGHLAWSRPLAGSATILVADASSRTLTRLTYPGAIGLWEGSVALSPDASHVALAAILNVSWPYRVFVSSVRGGPTLALLPLDGTTVDEWPAWTPDGANVLIPGIASVTKGSGSMVAAVSSDGSGVLQVLPVSSSTGPVAVSPDGTTLAVSLPDGIYLVGRDGSNQRQLAMSPAGRVLYSPSWSRDGTRLAFVSRHGFNEPPTSEPLQFQIFKTDLQGAASVVFTALGAGCDSYVSWGPGSKLAFSNCATDPDGGQHIYIADADTGQATALTSGKVFEDAPSWVP